MRTFLRRLAQHLVVALLASQALAATVTLSPHTPVAGQSLTVTYDPTDGPLTSATAIHILRAMNDWMQSASPNQPLIRDAATGSFSVTFTVPEPAYSLNLCFNDGARIWDNNGKANYNFAVTPGSVPPPIPGPSPLPANASRAGVMMQGFYWNCPGGGVWYDTMTSRAAGLRDMMDGQGIDRIWFPPPSKTMDAATGMGYAPSDYYDLGTFDQYGGVPTRFGTQAQLKRAIAAYKAEGIACMADIVLNHRSGGADEANPNLGGAKTWTDFSDVRSGKCAWRHDQFHPSTFEFCDDGAFGGFPDVCTVTGNAPGDARHDLIEWGNWLREPANAGFDGGWRFDFVKGYRPSFVAEFRAATGNAFGIVECLDGRVANVDAYVTHTGGTPAFDYPAYYTMRDVLNKPVGAGNIADLVNPDRVYAARNPAKAVTFAANHDNDEITTSGKMLAYAFILTYQGYPCIFWKDYFEGGLADLGGQSGNGIRRLVWVRGALGGGHPAIQNLRTDDRDLLVYGTLDSVTTAPGYIVAINDNPTSALTASVTTANAFLKGKHLLCQAWYSSVPGNNTQLRSVTVDPKGAVTLQAPPRGYAVYGPPPNTNERPAP